MTSQTSNKTDAAWPGLAKWISLMLAQASYHLMSWILQNTKVRWPSGINRTLGWSQTSQAHNFVPLCHEDICEKLVSVMSHYKIL